MKRWWQRRRRGALALVAVAGIVPATAMMTANINTSQMVDDRRQAQDAADALATLHGIWTSRALNIISMNNVTTAQLMSVSVGSESLYLTTTELTTGSIAATAFIAAHAAQHCTPRNWVEALLWSGPCAAQHTAVGVPAALALARAADINSDFEPLHGIRTAEKALEAIDGMNRALAERHARAMREISEEYAELLEITDHHFADPCIAPGPENCRETNSRDGMALPLEPAEMQSYAQLMILMETGTTTRDSTFRERGFDFGEGPLSHGGSTDRPHLIDHINHITEIGDALYEFRRFYQERHSHMIRRIGSGMGSGDMFSGFLPPRERDEPRTGFQDRRTDFYDITREIAEFAAPFNDIGLRIARNVPFMSWDAHPRSGYLLQPRQSRTDNSFHRNFRMMHALVALGDARSNMPLGLDLQGFTGFVFANGVPEIWQLRDLPILDFMPPVDALEMPDPYLIMAASLRDPSERLGSTVFGQPDTDPTGYGQAGIFNPDGASLYSQNWQMRLMEATRFDDPRDAGREMAREAVAGFDDLAETLRQINDQNSWERVNAH